LKGNPLKRHSPDMKVLLCFPLCFAAGLWADEAPDRAAINQVVVAINDPMQRPGLSRRGQIPAWISVG